MNPYRILEHFALHNYNTMITREDFEAHFHTTKEHVVFTLAGWDGKSYDGETRTARVLRTTLPGFENVRFVKVGKGLHYIDENDEKIELATMEYHKVGAWLIDVDRKTV